MELDPRSCYEAIKARDARFDGIFFVGVSTTRVYCRPVCTVRTPRRDRCTFYANPGSAEAAGYRPCLRCRPELSPGATPLEASQRTAALAVARIEAGALAESGVDELAEGLGLSSRQLRRVVEKEYGVSPLRFEQTRRLLLAKRLLTDTTMKVVDVAFASGFGSVRRFNHLFRSRYRLNPTALRRRPAADTHAVVLKLAYRPPFFWPALSGFLSSRGTSISEQLEGARYVRVVRIGKHVGWISAVQDPEKHVLHVEMAATLLPVLPTLLPRVRHLFDLDAAPAAIEAHLSRDRRLSRRVRAAPGLRVPGAIDGFELALRAVLGQEISVAAATTLYRRFTERFGAAVQTPYPGLEKAPPRAEEVADASVPDLMSLGLMTRRAETVKRLATSVADGTLRLSRYEDAKRVRETLLATPGIGPWTTEYVAMRVLGDPDACPTSDRGLLRALNLRRASELEGIAEAWRPWRAYAAVHLWNSLGGG